MTKSKVVGILGYIASLYPDYKIPDNPDNIVSIWQESLTGVDDKVIHHTIKEWYKESRYAPHLSDILKKVTAVTQEPMPEPSEVVAEIRRLASNSQQPMGDKPEHIREVVRLMGGLPSIGRKQWDQWLEKDILRVYGEWMSSQKKRQDSLKIGTVKSIG